MANVLNTWNANYSLSDCFNSEEASVSSNKKGTTIDDLAKNLFLLHLKLPPLKIHYSIVLVLVPLRLQKTRIENGKILVLLYTLVNFHSPRNRCNDIIRRAKRTFTKQYFVYLLSYPADKSFWLLGKNIFNFCKSVFPPFINYEDSFANIPKKKFV